ncbi:histone acetyltransferase type B catalytic subunit [Pelomyxa schiedti]|nr:histone acetyltransferase type B catalytic subunit [Pelomyxa schiedti]
MSLSTASCTTTTRRDPFTCVANDVIHMKFVRRREDIDDESTTFHPEYTHQIVSEDQQIRGYSDLKVLLYYTPSASTCYFAVSFRERTSDAVDIWNLIRQIMPETARLAGSVDEFLAAVEQEQMGGKFKPPGHQVHEYTFARNSTPLTTSDSSHQLPPPSPTKIPSPSDETFAVHFSSIADDPKAVAYHSIIQPFVLWFIDNSSFIKTEEPGWRLFTIFKKTEGLKVGEYSYQIIGFSTGYMFYHPWGKARLRVSQFMIFPPFQRSGHATQLLRAIYNVVRADPTIVDVTVEDASDELTRVRDLLDLHDLQESGFWPVLQQAPKLTREAYATLRERLKLCWIQAKRCHTILRLKYAKEQHDESVSRQLRLYYKTVLYWTLKQQHTKGSSQQTSRRSQQNTEATTGENLKLQLHQMWLEVEREFNELLEIVQSKM